MINLFTTFGTFGEATHADPGQKSMTNLGKYNSTYCHSTVFWFAMMGRLVWIKKEVKWLFYMLTFHSSAPAGKYMPCISFNEVYHMVKMINQSLFQSSVNGKRNIMISKRYVNPFYFYNSSTLNFFSSFWFAITRSHVLIKKGMELKISMFALVVTFGTTYRDLSYDVFSKSHDIFPRRCDSSNNSEISLGEVYAQILSSGKSCTKASSSAAMVESQRPTSNILLI